MELKLLDVSKFYQTGKKSVKGVENVNLTFTTDSSFVVITGESGSGKTTLIKLLTGIENFDDGEIYFDDIPISTLSANKRQDIYTQNVSFVFQDYNLIEGFTAKENIMLALLKKGIEKKEASEKALEALDNLQIKDLYKKKISKLSGGEKQRVAIARALALESKVIIFDEPTGNLDKETSETLVNVIREKCKDKLVIYVTHEYSLVKDAATRHIVLQDGHVIEDKSFKKEKNDDTRVNDKEIKFSFKSLLYVAKLFSFKRIGRLIFSFLVLLGSVLTSLSVSTALANLFTSTSSAQNDDSFMQGNVINVEDKKQMSDDTLSNNAYYDVNSLIFDNVFNMYLKDTVDTFSETSKEMNSQIYFTSIIPYSMRINTALPKNLKLEFGSKIDDVNSLYLVLNESSINGLYNRNIRSKIEAAVGKEISLLPMNTNRYFYDSKYSVEDYYKNDSEIQQKIDFTEIETKYYVNLLKGGKTFKLAGVYINSKSNIDEYIYAPSFNLLKEVGNHLSPRIKLENIDIISQERMAIYQPKTKSYNIDIISSDNKYFSRQSKDNADKGWSYETAIEPYALSTFNFNELNTIYISSFWENTDLDIKIDNLVYKKSQLNNIRYISNELIGNKYHFYTLGNPAALVLQNSKQCGKLYYHNEQDAQIALNKIKGNADVMKYDAKDYLTIVAVDSNSIGILYAALQAFLLLFLMAALFGGFALFRLILNKIYFRKAADQFVLNYIGYTRKDIFLTNLVQFESLALLSSIIVYSLSMGLSDYNIILLQFLVVPYLFIIPFVLNLLFVAYLSIPFRHVGGGRVND